MTGKKSETGLSSLPVERDTELIASPSGRSKGYFVFIEIKTQGNLWDFLMPGLWDSGQQFLNDSGSWATEALLQPGGRVVCPTHPTLWSIKMLKAEQSCLIRQKSHTHT
jgi:hypothetical protein